MPSLLVVETSIVVDCAMSWMYWLELMVNFCLLLKLTLPLTQLFAQPGGRNPAAASAIAILLILWLLCREPLEQP
jgi:hypothetical protein